jgi:hypothetical protein
MAIAGVRGACIADDALAAGGLFDECCAGYVVETAEPDAVAAQLVHDGVPHLRLGTVTDEPVLELAGARQTVAALGAAWRGDRR